MAPKATAARRTPSKRLEDIKVVIAPTIIDHSREVVERYKAKIRNPKTAIRAFCVECSGGYLKEVAECRVVKCALHPFRMGVNPFNKTVQARLASESGETDDEDDDTGETE